MKKNDKVINKNKYDKTKTGKKERLDNQRKNNVILDNVNKRRVAYKNGTSVFDPDYEYSMKIATVKARSVIPKYRQANLPASKLNEKRYILVVDCIKNNILYLNLTSPKESQYNNDKYLRISNFINKEHECTVVDLLLDNVDYSSKKRKGLAFRKIIIKDNVKLNSKNLQKIYRAVNSKIKNLNLSHKIKNCRS